MNSTYQPMIAMLPYIIGGWGNWAKIPCKHQLENVRILCNSPRNNDGMKDLGMQPRDGDKNNKDNYVRQDAEKKIVVLIKILHAP